MICRHSPTPLKCPWIDLSRFCSRRNPRIDKTEVLKLSLERVNQINWKPPRKPNGMGSLRRQACNFNNFEFENHCLECYLLRPPDIKSYKDTPKSFKPSPPYLSTLSTNGFRLLIFNRYFYTFDLWLVSLSQRDSMEGLITVSAYTIRGEPRDSRNYLRTIISK